MVRCDTMDEAARSGVYNWTGPTGVQFTDIRHKSGTWYRKGTPTPVIEGLERSRTEGARIRLFYGDTDTGRDWCEENDVRGTVGRSAGTIRIPLLLKSSRSSGGGAILDACIIRLQVAGREVYRHPKYQVPDLAVIPASEKLRGRGYLFTVTRDGDEFANFKTRDRADRYVAFLLGERGSP
jgi:hypothetical protein